MGEKSYRILLYCNLTVLLVEVTVLFLILALVKQDGVLPNNAENEMMKQIHPKLRRSVKNMGSASFRNSRICQKMQEYYNFRCFDFENAEETTRPTVIQQEQTFVQDLLKYFDEYSRTLRESQTTSQPLNDPPQENNMEVPPENSEIGVASLWQENVPSSEKCRLEGLGGSLACQFEYEYPEQALRLYKLLRPVLITEINNETLSRTSRSNDDYSSFLNQNVMEPIPENEKRKRRRREIDLKNKSSSRRKRSSARNRNAEVCPTSFLTRSLAHACHARTGQSVSLYLFRGGNRTRDLHLQLYELGNCVSAVPIGIDSNTTIRPVCRNATSRILAYFLISIQEAAAGNYERCFNITETPYVVCRDWILVESYCKLFYSDSDPTVDQDTSLI